MNILGIETSCDETAAAVVRDGREVLSNVVYTQIPLHRPYGGVVPEIASRAHVEKITQVVKSAMDGQDVDAVAVTYGPGLSPALIVGLNAAKGLALSLGVDLIAINHIEAHLHTPFLYDRGETPPCPDPSELYPSLGLAISGGHTNWFDIAGAGEYTTIGQTLDDAAGEAFDKASKLLGLGYPGGPRVDKIAKAYLAANGGSTKGMIPFPKGRPRDGVSALAGLPAELCVSFSGLKTALLRHVQRNPDLQNPDPALQDADPSQIDPNSHLACVIASYQEAIVQAVADRTRTALRRRGYKAFVLGGGVSLNSRLRAVLSEVASEARIPLLMAKPRYCGDNGAMIAGLAYTRRNISGGAALAVDVAPSLEVG
ncbi:MAG: tRNA (adenosine(37)-N6)-threonylcarbamoyltransferase complex transferase subunit TsaD [Kiritimatiellae bacterium]|nr:tRNA (adenosine(37)-N6)-threonylcarbamoyltransferase complex transferase subunit TsaD [Kiritimatiellia bacterium]